VRGNPGIGRHRGWLTGLGARQRALAGLLLGLGIALGQAPWSEPFASLVAFVVVLRIFLSLDGRRAAFWFGWFTGAGYFAALLFWIVDPFMVDAAHDAWMAPFALLFMAGGMALFWGGGFLAAAAIASGRLTRLLALIVCLGLAEMLRSYVLTGFPWGLIGYIWSDTPLIGLAAWIGPHGVGAVTLVLAALPLVWRKPLVGLATSGIILGAFWGVGLYRDGQPVEPRKTPVRLRLVQPNATQEEKWDARYAPVFFQRLLSLSKGGNGPPPDLVIWPETAVTFWLGEKPGLQKLIAEAASPARAIIGARRVEGANYFNSLAILSKSGTPEAIYDKRHLVPFGEYIPFGNLLSSLGIHGLAANEGGGFSEGTKSGLLDMGDAGNVRVLICYEAIFPQILTRGTTRPDWILQITNDAWFGKIAGPQQHLAIAKFRAVEQGLPLVRVANTGISGVIDARGRLVDKLPLGTAGRLDTVVPGSLPPTLYSRTGDWLMLVVYLLGLSAIAARRSRRPKA